MINENAAAQAKQVTNTLIAQLDISDKAVKSRYEYALKGFTSELTSEQLKALRNNPQIDRVVQDHTFDFAPSNIGNSNYSTMEDALSSSQTTPWGISRVGGPVDGSGKKAWIIDTGIDLDHPDLNVDVANSASFVADESTDDINGHGTHVAGILGAKDNSRDVVGVAAGATVVGVKVLHDDPSENKYSEIIDGIDYVAGKASPGDIVNLSLGDPTPDNSTIDNAVTTAANNGIRFVISAGNEQQNAQNVTPARVENNNVWTISAFDDSDRFATAFSNYGNPPIEYSGPGVNVYSLDKNGGTTTKDGTSMSAPHVAGLLLAAPNGVGTDGTVSDDQDSNPDDIAVAAQPEPTLTVSVSGPQYLNSGQSGTWSASVSYNDGPVSYEWFRRESSSDPWSSTSETSSSYTTYFYNGSSTDKHAGVKVKVSSAGENDLAAKSVIVSSSDCDPLLTAEGEVTPNAPDPCY